MQTVKGQNRLAKFEVTTGFCRSLLTTLLVLVSIALGKSAAAIDLSADERDWLAAHPVLRVMNEPDYAPFDFQRNGKPTGYSIDYLQLLAQRLGVRLEFVQHNFAKLLQKAQRREVDLLHSLSMTLPERASYLNFTRPYKQTVNAIVTRSDKTGINRLDDLRGRTVALVRGEAEASTLPQRFPCLPVLEVDTYEAALKAIAFGRADATVTELPVAMRMAILSAIDLGAISDLRKQIKDARLVDSVVGEHLAVLAGSYEFDTTRALVGTGETHLQ